MGHFSGASVNSFQKRLGSRKKQPQHSSYQKYLWLSFLCYDSFCVGLQFQLIAGVLLYPYPSYVRHETCVSHSHRRVAGVGKCLLPITIDGSLLYPDGSLFGLALETSRFDKGL